MNLLHASGALEIVVCASIVESFTIVFVVEVVVLKVLLSSQRTNPLVQTPLIEGRHGVYVLSGSVTGHRHSPGLEGRHDISLSQVLSAILLWVDGVGDEELVVAGELDVDLFRQSMNKP